MHCMSVSVLGVLNEKHHQECHDRGPGVDNELPRVREVKDRARQTPYRDDERGKEEGSGVAHHLRGRLGKLSKPPVHAAVIAVEWIRIRDAPTRPTSDAPRLPHSLGTSTAPASSCEPPACLHGTHLARRFRTWLPRKRDAKQDATTERPRARKSARRCTRESTAVCARVVRAKRSR